MPGDANRWMRTSNLVAMLALESQTALRSDVLRRTWTVPVGWRQGRGAWGGLIATAIVRAVMVAEGTMRPVRAVNLAFLGPVPEGDVTLVLTQLRRGSATATWRVELLDPQAQGIAVHAVVILGDDRSPGIDDILRRPEVDAQMPVVPAWTEVDPVTIGAPLGPEFSQHLNYFPVQGVPYSGSSDDVLCWVSYAEGAWDAASVIGLVDAMWPIAIIRVTEHRPMATINFSASLLVDPSTLPPGEPLLHVCRAMGVSGGYSTEHRQLWSADGRLVVDNPQVIAVIR